MVTISETRKVPGSWQPDKKYEGWKAISEDGKTYFCNWEVFPDNSMTPAWAWTDEDGEVWYDVCQGIHEPIPFKPWFVYRYYAIIHYCERHRRLDYINRSESWREFAIEQGVRTDNPCFDCLLKKPSYEETRKGWKGWRK